MFRVLVAGEATITGEGKEAKKLLYPSWGQLIVETPIHNAAEHGTSMLRALLSSSSASVNMAVSPDGYTPLHIAATTVKSGQTYVSRSARCNYRV